MDRTLPGDDDLQVDPVRRERWTAGVMLARPHYRSPPGVTMRPLEPGEVQREPVLVCKACNRPELHVRTIGPVTPP